MKKTILKITVFLLIFAGYLSSCQKANELNMSNIENLYEQPLSVIQKCVQGKWKWDLYISGFAGWIVLDNGLVEITEDKMITSKGVQEYFWKQQKMETHFGIIETYVMWDKQNDIPICFFERIINDTLKVNGSQFNMDISEFIRINN